jgi:hypothetical protein
MKSAQIRQFRRFSVNKTTSGTVALLAFLIGIVTAGREVQAGFAIGSTYSITGTNSPTNFSANVTLSPGISTIDGGLLSLTQTVTSIGNTEWLNLSFQATSGLLASNIFGAWEINVEGVDLSAPAYNTAIMVYWTVDGSATEPIYPFLEFNPVGPNPLSPTHQDAYIRYFQPGGEPVTVLGEYASISNYNAINEGGMNPNAVNGFDLAIQITTVPEPSAWVLGAIATAAGGTSCRFANKRRQRRADGGRSRC